MNNFIFGVVVLLLNYKGEEEDTLIENGAELIIYHNPSYDEYGDCYLIYCNGGGLYINTPTESFKVVQAKYMGEVTLENIDQYAYVRNFSKVLTAINLSYSNDTNIEWFNNTHEDLKDRLIGLKNKIIELARSVNQSDPFTTHLYIEINELLHHM